MVLRGAKRAENAETRSFKDLTLCLRIYTVLHPQRVFEGLWVAMGGVLWGLGEVGWWVENRIFEDLTLKYLHDTRGA